MPRNQHKSDTVEKRVPILSFKNAVCLICQFNSAAKRHSSFSSSCYLLFVSHSNLVIKLFSILKAINSSPTSQILWNMCYFSLHYISCFLRCFFLKLLIIVTRMDGGIKQADAESSVLFQLTFSGVMKYVVVLHRPLLYFVVKPSSFFSTSLFHAVPSLFSAPELELFL